ncbi:hypothetical protein GCM10027267_10550 [Paramicrobacterium agarici]
MIVSDACRELEFLTRACRTFRAEKDSKNNVPALRITGQECVCPLPRVQSTKHTKTADDVVMGHGTLGQVRLGRVRSCHETSVPRLHCNQTEARARCA